jgi:hypothetical protein
MGATSSMARDPVLAANASSPDATPLGAAAVATVRRQVRGREKPAERRYRRLPPSNMRSGEIDHVRERIRGRIACALFGLLTLVVLISVLGLVIGRLTVGDLRELFASLGPLTMLVGTLMGFYFGRVTK